MKNKRTLAQKIKPVSRYALALLIGFSLTLSSCKKEQTGNGFTPATYRYTDDVYIAGTFTLAGKRYPAYWKNGVKKPLGTTTGYVAGIAVNGANVYVVGYTGTDNITLWKNGKAIAVVAGAKPYANAYAIALSNTDVYVAGYQEDGMGGSRNAKYWKIGADNKPIETILPKLPGNESDDEEGYAIAVSGTHVYVVGYISGSYGNYVAALWKDGKFTALTDGTHDAEGYAIAVSGTDVYVGGYDDNHASYWKNDGTPANTHILESNDSYTNYNCIAVKDNKVYMAWNDYSTKPDKAMYWDGVKKIPLSTTSLIYEYANSIAVAGNNVYVTGNFNKGPGNQRSILWKNGQKVPGFEGSQDIDARALFVVKK